MSKDQSSNVLSTECYHTTSVEVHECHTIEAIGQELKFDVIVIHLSEYKKKAKFIITHLFMCRIYISYTLAAHSIVYCIRRL